MRLNAQHRWYLNAMGISTWTLRERQDNKAEHPPISTSTESACESIGQHSIDPTNNSQANWLALEKNIRECVACDLHKTRTQVVFGVGNKQADCMIVGEAPGADEDRQGEPFVGRAGKLLNNMLFAIGLQREDVFIANILKCRPPNNRDPKLEEIVHCETFLQSQMNLIKPKVIVALGRVAAHNLLKTDEALSVLRGKHVYYGETKIPVVVTYHPAYLLRSPREKRKSWQDLQLIQAMLKGV